MNSISQQPSLNNKENRLDKITIIQFFLCVMVVFIHAQNTEKYNLDTSMLLNEISVNFQNNLVYNVFSCAVPAFLFISAFLMFRNFSMDKLWQKYKSRIKSLVIPYLIWNTIYMIYFFLLTNLPIISKIMVQEKVELNAENIFKGVFLHQYSGVLWFLKTLIVLVILTPVIYFVFRTPILAEICVLLLYCFSLPDFLSPVLYNTSASIFYLYGAFVALRYKKYWEMDISAANVKLCRILLCVLLIIQLILPQPIFTVAFIFLLWFSFNSKTTPKIRWWYKFSFLIYLSHVLVMSVVKKMGDIFLPTNALSMNFMFVFAPACSILIIVFIGKLFKKILPKTYGILTGER